MSQEQEFAEEYSEENFWQKVRGYATAAGRDVILKALQLYYVLQSSKPSTKAKATIIAALGYFIAPMDAIPDLIPAVGYADDLGALAIALSTIAKLVTPEVRALALQKTGEWFSKKPAPETEKQDKTSK